MRKILFIVATLLVIAGGLTYWGSMFAAQTVGEQLSTQKIKFPEKADWEKSCSVEKSDAAKTKCLTLISHAGVKVDNGMEAKAYSEYIGGHLEKVANGQTYSEVSSAYQKDKSNQALSGQRQTLFMGETLRGLLLNAWGWGLIGTIALYASYAMFAVAILVYVVALYPRTYSRKSTKKSRK